MMIDNYIDQYIQMYNEYKIKIGEFKNNCENKINSFKIEELVIKAYLQLNNGIVNA
jgi:hypothetical protein